MGYEKSVTGSEKKLISPVEKAKTAVEEKTWLESRLKELEGWKKDVEQRLKDPKGESERVKKEKEGYLKQIERRKAYDQAHLKELDGRISDPKTWLTKDLKNIVDDIKRYEEELKKLE